MVTQIIDKRTVGIPGAVGPQGPQGPQGAQGVQGPEGPFGGTAVTDPQVASYLVPGTQTRSALDVTFSAASTLDIHRILVVGETLANDGVVDATAQLERALSAGESWFAMTGRPIQIVVPEGRYRVDTELVARSGVGFRGAGRGVTVFLPYGANAFLRGNQAGTWDGQPYEDLYFEDFTVDCINQTYTDYHSRIKGIFIQDLVRMRARNVNILNSWATAFGMDYLRDSYMVDCFAMNSGRGRQFYPGSNQQWGTGACFGMGMGKYPDESLTLMNCTAIGAFSHAFFFERLHNTEAVYYSRGVRMLGCQATGCWDGVLDAGAGCAVIDGCTFIGNTFAGVLLRHTGNELQGGVNGLVANCMIVGNGTVGLIEGNAGDGGGIVLSNASGGAYSFVNNIVLGNNGPGLWARATSKPAPGISLRGGRVADNKGPGVFLEAATVQFSVDDVEIRGNGGAGVKATAPTGLLSVRASKINDNDGAAVELSGSVRSVKPDIRGNDLRFNRRASILIDHIVDDSTGITDNLTDNPVTVTNLCTGPSAVYGTTGMVAIGSTLTVVDDADFASGKAIEVSTSAGGANYGARSQSAAISAGRLYTGAVSVKAPFGKRYYVTMTFGSTEYVSGVLVGMGTVQRHYVSFVAQSGTVSRVGVSAPSAFVTAGDKFRVDEFDVFEGITHWPHIDGDQDHAVWNGTVGASTSTYTVPNGLLLRAQIEAIAGGAAVGYGEGNSSTSGDALLTNPVPANQPYTLYVLFDGTPVTNGGSTLRDAASATVASLTRAASGYQGRSAPTSNTLSATTIASGGSGPTAVAMVVTELTRKVHEHAGNTVETNLTGWPTLGPVTQMSRGTSAYAAALWTGAHDEATVNSILATMVGYVG